MCRFDCRTQDSRCQHNYNYYNNRALLIVPDLKHFYYVTRIYVIILCSHVVLSNCFAHPTCNTETDKFLRVVFLSIQVYIYVHFILFS